MKTLIKPLLIAFSLFVLTGSAALAGTVTSPNRPKAVATYQSGIFTTAEGKLQIALNKQTGGWVDIRLTNAAGKVLFVQQVSKHQTEARLRLDVSNLPDGTYELTITNGRDTTRQALTLATPKHSEPNRLIALN